MKKYFLTSFVFVFTAFQLTAQKFETALARLALEHQPQKIYIHYDREYYVSGRLFFLRPTYSVTGSQAVPAITYTYSSPTVKGLW